jgi:thymidylate synthase (FAD)
MRFVTPSAHMIAATAVNEDGIVDMLEALGAPEDWDTDAPSDAEKLIEVSGRLCYKAFGTEMNANLTRVREGNKDYVANIIKSRHGSVLEHASASYAIIDCTPVLTHELVRHRAGTAFSQVSMRFVRLTDIGFYYPMALEESFIKELFDSIPDEEWDKLQSSAVVTHKQAEARDVANDLRARATQLLKDMEAFQVDAAVYARLDHVKNFNLKKRFTSAMRRLAPYGLATAIVCTGNHRMWRHTIAVRTSRHAEEEVRFVFGDIARDLAERYPNIYQDMRGEVVDGLQEFTFENEKV